LFDLLVWRHWTLITHQPPERADFHIVGTWGRWRVALAVVLAVLTIGSVSWIGFGWPLQFRIWIPLLLIAGASLAAFVGLFVKEELALRMRTVTYTRGSS
jgi:hypothetical protein